jgi:hypothetical protein
MQSLTRGPERNGCKAKTSGISEHECTAEVSKTYLTQF